MAAEHILDIASTEPLVRYVHDRVASGQYATTSEVVQAALRASVRREADERTPVDKGSKTAQLHAN